ncbi:Polypeptide N-acetylgalactosaminyltransferase 6 [Triplophysa tibetana]|uniref:Polypeptide N-acetylgalactosaminyltransferase 6 n=1 Tax=Triplophysa tibetana TaxID=1572043 RepID=A0A5A9NCM9_9TELE|nr:Polypeptide N-acetylgalactosaminyltransferase 6 [Triplophysa tibetana]
MNIIAPPLEEEVLPLSENASCSSGFYSMVELKPHIQRPLEDPKGPGADGNLFITGMMAPAELREKQEGWVKNGFSQYASDRISLHRSLAADTRPPERTNGVDTIKHFEYTSHQELRHNNDKKLCLHATPEPESVRVEPSNCKGDATVPAPQQILSFILVSPQALYRSQHPLES